MAMTGFSGVPPIEVYCIDEVYFVLDGNHCVSVAREVGLTHLQAYLTEVITRVSLSPDVQRHDLIVQAEYIDFLERTRRDELRPEANLVITGLAQPPTGGLRTRLGSEFRILMRRCPRPVLVVPGAHVAPQRALLAYDGSPKSEEALCVASYLAGWWSLSLVIVTVNESAPRASKIQKPARS